MLMSTTSKKWLILKDGRVGTDGQVQGMVESLKFSYEENILNVPKWQYYFPVHD